MPRTKTPNQGAGDTRVQIIRKIRRMHSVGYLGLGDGADRLIAWIKSMDERAAKKKGGLGRK